MPYNDDATGSLPLWGDQPPPIARSPRPAPFRAPRPADGDDLSHRWRVWKPEQEARLRAMFSAGERVPAMARELGRPPRGIAAKLRDLGLIARRRDAPY